MTAVGFTSGDVRKVSRTGDTMSGSLALLGTADLSVQDDVAVGDDMTIGGTLVVVGTAELGGKNGLFSLPLGGRLGAPGPPVADTWIAGDLVIDSVGAWWLCTAGGTPGTWVAAPVVGTTPGTVAAGDDSRIVGAVQSALADAKGDLIVATAADAFTRLAVGTDGYQPYADPVAASGIVWRPADPLTLGAGTTTLSRQYGATNTNVAVGASGTLRLTYFVAPRSETISQLAIIVGTVPAGATPTLAQIAVFSVAVNGDLTRVGVTANDTTMFAVASTRVARPLTASYNAVGGTAYAFGPLIVTAAAMPSFLGVSLNQNTAQAFASPRISAQIAGQATMPLSILNASLAASNALMFGEILP